MHSLSIAMHIIYCTALSFVCEICLTPQFFVLIFCLIICPSAQFYMYMSDFTLLSIIVSGAMGAVFSIYKCSCINEYFAVNVRYRGLPL